MKWFVRKSLPVPTWPTLLLGSGLIAALTGLLLCGLYPWLAVDHFASFDDSSASGREKGASLLVVEGWATDSCLDEAVRIFQSGEYPKIASTGGPTTGMQHLFEVETYARFGAKRLIERGVAEEKIVVAPALSVDRRRTQRSALDLKAELVRLGEVPRLINIVTSDVHARRSRMIYARVFGDETLIGVRGVPPENFEPDSWWNSSAGIKTVILELVSVIYDSFAPRRSH